MRNLDVAATSKQRAGSSFGTRAGPSWLLAGGWSPVFCDYPYLYFSMSVASQLKMITGLRIRNPMQSATFLCAQARLSEWELPHAKYELHSIVLHRFVFRLFSVILLPAWENRGLQSHAWTFQVNGEAWASAVDRVLSVPIGAISSAATDFMVTALLRLYNLAFMYQITNMLPSGNAWHFTFLLRPFTSSTSLR